MKLYSVTITNLSGRRAFAVRATSAAAAVSLVLGPGEIRHFQHVDVVVLDEPLLELPEPEAKASS